MSVPVQNPINQIIIVGGETTAVWTWFLKKESELVVLKNIASTGDTVLLVLGVDYTVNPAGLGMDGGGTINFQAPQLPAQAGDVWTMLRDTTLDRSDNFAKSGDFFAQTINDQLDKLTRLAQDTDRVVQAAVRKDPGVGDVLNPLIPKMVDRRTIVFQDNGGGNFEMIMSGQDPDATSGDAGDSAAAAAASAAEAEANAAEAAQSAIDAENSAQSIAIGQPYLGEVKPSGAGTLISSDNGKLIKVDTTGGDVVITLIDSAILTTDFRIAFWKTVSANKIILNKAGTDTINTGLTTFDIDVKEALINFVLDQSTGNWSAASITQTDLSSPPPIGDNTPNTVKATTFQGDAGGVAINEYSTDGTLSGNSDDAVPTEKAVKEYADTKLSGGAGIIAQADLKSTTGEVSFFSNSTIRVTTLFTLPGGQYGFSIEDKHPTLSGSSGGWLGTDDKVTSGTFLTRIVLVIDGAGIGTGRTTTVRQRFVQASPPYDLGDGVVDSFIYALIKNVTGEIVAMYHAPDPPWANNGPTCIEPEYKKKGKLYRKNCIIDKTKNIQDPERYKYVEQEITNDFKNSDMALIPHPFQGNDMAGKSIILIDPTDPIVLRAEVIKNAGESALEELFHKGYVRFRNEHLKGRATPHSSVMVVKPSWKNSNV